VEGGAKRRSAVISVTVAVLKKSKLPELEIWMSSTRLDTGLRDKQSGLA
jgi:hypothetical protein